MYKVQVAQAHMAHCLLVEAHVNEHRQGAVTAVGPKQVLRLLSQACEGVFAVVRGAVAGVNPVLQATHHTSVHDDGLQSPSHTNGLLHMHIAHLLECRMLQYKLNACESSDRHHSCGVVGMRNKACTANGVHV